MIEESQVIESSHKQYITEIESNIKKIWSSLLNESEIENDDNFFEVGGDSVKLIAMFKEISQLYPDTIEITDIFAFPTIFDLSQLIESKRMLYEGEDTKEEDIGIANYEMALLDDEKNVMFEFNLALERYKEVCREKKFEIKHLLIAVYVFLMSEAFKQNEILIYQYIDKLNKAVQIKFDTLDIENFYDFVYIVKNKFVNICENVSNIEDTKVDTNCINTLFYNYGENYCDIASIYDFIFEVNEKVNKICIRLKSNNKRLELEKIKIMVSDYIKLLEVIAENS